MYTIKLCYVLYSTYCEIPWPRSIRCTFRCDALDISVISRLHRYPSLPQLLFEVVDIPRNQGFRKKTEPNSVRNSVRRAMVQILLVTRQDLDGCSWGIRLCQESPPGLFGTPCLTHHKKHPHFMAYVSHGISPLNGWLLTITIYPSNSRSIDSKDPSETN